MERKNLSLYLERLEELFQILIRRLHNDLAHSLDGGITASQFIVMKRIHAKGKLTVSDVAEDLGVSLSAVTSLIDRLYKSGLVNRRRDEEDRRLVWLELTSDGENVLISCNTARKAIIEKYFSVLPDEDLEHLVRIYQKLLDANKNALK